MPKKRERRESAREEEERSQRCERHPLCLFWVFRIVVAGRLRPSDARQRQFRLFWVRRRAARSAIIWGSPVTNGCAGIEHGQPLAAHKEPVQVVLLYQHAHEISQRHLGACGAGHLGRRCRCRVPYGGADHARRHDRARGGAHYGVRLKDLMGRCAHLIAIVLQAVPRQDARRPARLLPDRPPRTEGNRARGRRWPCFGRCGPRRHRYFFLFTVLLRLSLFER